uniref:Uncharacterized protein n=1 Tax=Pyramimonas obovata TaxID=1411642 RepID=A0A7S0RMQ3_9CHLO|mmetsp:Transcript_37468/g.81569  ORF Transcript_37468/g.81569 Transcript_37468/m.81569 type:complete len:117 (+) Transcript_37468:261-611(+)
MTPTAGNSSFRRRGAERDPAPVAEEVSNEVPVTCKENNGKRGVSPNKPLHAALVLGLLGVGVVMVMSTVFHMFFFYDAASRGPDQIHQWNPKLDDPFEDGGGVFSGKELKELLKQR